MVVGIGGAPITTSFASVLIVPFGESVELRCDGVGPPAPDLYWTKGSVRIRNSTQGRLKIRNSTLQDNGVYSCHAVNYLGRQEKETRIGTHGTQLNVILCSMCCLLFQVVIRL